MENLLLATDVYKMGHMEQYEPSVTHIYSTLQARSNRVYPEFVHFGLQYYLQQYLSCYAPTYEHIEEFMDIRRHILGPGGQDDVRRKLQNWRAMGYTPLRIRALPEGTRLTAPNVTATIENRIPGYHWLVGYVESLLLKVWATSTVAAKSLQFYRTAESWADLTCDNKLHLPFAVHDFGYRGVSSEETAAVSGAAHLLAFRGTDTIKAVKLLRDHYAPKPETMIGVSVPASEHSVVESFGPNFEHLMLENMLKLYPTGILSVVSDTYDVYQFVHEWARMYRDQILARDGKVVFRPDSGDPEKIICGDPDSPDPLARMGILQALWEIFGGYVNGRGYRVLNPKVGLIYGDGFYLAQYDSVLRRMSELGFASSNLVIGVGGLLLQQNNRDELGFAFKATAAKYNDEKYWQPIFKDPVTDPGKKSFRGCVMITSDGDKLVTSDGYDESTESRLKTVYLNGVVTNPLPLETVRANMDLEKPIA